MDKQVKQQAVNKFSQLIQSGASIHTVREAVGKEFKGDDVDEIIDALPKPDQDLPGKGRADRPDQDLPERDKPGKPDQGLPEKPGKPDQELPEKPAPKK